MSSIKAFLHPEKWEEIFHFLNFTFSHNFSREPSTRSIPNKATNTCFKYFHPSSPKALSPPDLNNFTSSQMMNMAQPKVEIKVASEIIIVAFEPSELMLMKQRWLLKGNCSLYTFREAGTHNSWCRSFPFELKTLLLEMFILIMTRFEV